MAEKYFDHFCYHHKFRNVSNFGKERLMTNCLNKEFCILIQFT